MGRSGKDRMERYSIDLSYKRVLDFRNETGYSKQKQEYMLILCYFGSSWWSVIHEDPHFHPQLVSAYIDSFHI